SLRIGLSSPFVQPLAPSQDLSFSTVVTLIRGHVPDSTVPMLPVVPSGEARHPTLRTGEAVKGQPRIGRRVFEGAEQCFGVRIVIRDVRSAEGRYDPEPLQRCDEGTGAHRFAVVGVQYEALGIEVTLSAGVGDELGGDLCRASLGDAPADDTTAPDIQHQIKVQVYAPHGRRQPGDVPAPDLVGAAGPMQPRSAADVSAGDGASPAAQPISALQPVEGGFRGEVQAPIGKLRYKLLRGEVSEACAHHELQKLRFLPGAEGVCRATVRPTSTVIRIRSTAPALNGSSRDPGDLACLPQSGTAQLGFADGIEDQLSLGSSAPSSSSGCIFPIVFFSTRSAAASAKAFSLRASSRSSWRMRLLVALDCRPSSCSAIRQRSKSASLIPSRSRYACSCSPRRLAASASTRAFCSSVKTCSVTSLEPTSGRLRASCSQRDRFCCRTPVCRESCDAERASLPVSRSIIFCLNARE